VLELALARLLVFGGDNGKKGIDALDSVDLEAFSVVSGLGHLIERAR
jgi:hypothetical protein